MLPDSSIAVCISSGKVRSRPDRSQEQAADDGADTVALGPSDADYGVGALRAHAQSAVTSAGSYTGLAGGVATGYRPGSTQCRCVQRGMDEPAVFFQSYARH